MSSNCEKPCERLGRFVDKNALTDPHHCLKSHEYAKIKNHADKSCLFKGNVDECPCETEEVIHAAEAPEAPKQESPLLSDQLCTQDFALSEYKRADESKNPACYLPQVNDDVPSKDHMEPMGPIGPWATGKVDWSPLAGITGTRPVVDHYSITRYSGNEWRKRNKEVLDKTFDAFERTAKNDNDCRNIMVKTYTILDKTQAQNTERLRVRARLINKWKCALERSIKAMAEEISVLEEQRIRLKQSLLVLKLPEAIAGECLDRRCSRPEPELVRDRAEEELMKELALTAEIRLVLEKTLKDIETQQEENRTARHRMEYDWSDKKESYEIDTHAISLNNLSTITMFYPGATRFPAEQSTDEYWEHFTTVSLEECEKCRQKSVSNSSNSSISSSKGYLKRQTKIALRSTLDAILLNAARDLRAQADVIEQALRTRIACMQEIENRLVNELKDCLQKLVETERRIEKMTKGMKALDNTMKVAQTRLNNRNYRPHVENSRDIPQRGLMEEVSIVQQGVSNMLQALTEAEAVKTELMNTRGNLEREIMLKRRAIMLDRDRGMLLRSRFPSANALSGYAKT